MKIFLFIKIFCIFYLLSNCSPSIFDKSNIQKELTNFDKILFPYLLSSYMWHSEFFNEYQETSTDQVYEKTFEWIRFRSAVGANIGEANDFCFGVKNAGNDLNLLFLHIKPGETCDSENNKVLFSLNKIKRAIWTWPKNESQKNFTLKISVEWIEKGQWKKNDLFFDLPHYPKNHTSIFWGKTWRNQKPFKELENMLPLHIFFIEDKKNTYHNVKTSLIPHTKLDQWRNAQVCFAVDDECKPIMLEQCSLCEKGYFTLYNTKCLTHGTTFCGEIRCGERGQPACYLGQQHIKQDDFKGCSPFTEEWFCHHGLEIQCTKEGAICY